MHSECCFAPLGCGWGAGLEEVEWSIRPCDIFDELEAVRTVEWLQLCLNRETRWRNRRDRDNWYLEVPERVRITLHRGLSSPGSCGWTDSPYAVEMTGCSCSSQGLLNSVQFCGILDIASIISAVDWIINVELVLNLVCQLSLHISSLDL